MSGGWFLMHRGWMASPDFKPEPFTEPQAFIWSIEQAAHTSHWQWFNGTLHPVERGEFVTSYRVMAAAFGWSVKRVRSFTARMVTAQKWSQRVTQLGAHGPTILTLCNYERFQTLPKRAGTPEGTGKDTVEAQQGHSEGTQQNEGITPGNEGKGEASPTAAEHQAAVSAYNEAAVRHGWETVRGSRGSTRDHIILSDTLRRQLNARIKEEGLDGFLEGIARASASPWLGGTDPPAWWNFSKLVSATGFSKLKSGSYDKPINDGRAQQSSGWGAAYTATH